MADSANFLFDNHLSAEIPKIQIPSLVRDSGYWEVAPGHHPVLA